MRFIQLPIGTHVVLSHDHPKRPTNQTVVRYAKYKENLLGDVLPRFLSLFTFTLTECYGEKLVGNVLHGIAHVFSEYVLVMNGDIALVRHVPLMSVIRAMSLHPDGLHYARFNHRANIFSGCDRSYFGNFSEARLLFRQVSYEGMLFTRSVCYFDMAFVVNTNFSCHRIFKLAWVRRHNSSYDATYPESVLQREIALEPRAWGMHIWGATGAPATTEHLNGRRLSPRREK